jgi:hypothetical protein
MKSLLQSIMVLALTFIGCKSHVDDYQHYKYVIMQDVDNNPSTTDSIIAIKEFPASSDSAAYRTCITDMFQLMLRDCCRPNIVTNWAVIDSSGNDVKDKLPEKYKNELMLSSLKEYQRMKQTVDYEKRKLERQLRYADSLSKP